MHQKPSSAQSMQQQQGALYEEVDATAKSPLGSSETKELKEIEMKCNSAYATTTYQ